MSSSAPRPPLTPAEYLAIERAAEIKSEFHDGRMHAMASASLPHNRIVGNLTAALHDQLRGGPCAVVAQDLRVAVGLDAFFYPDILIVCGDLELSDDHFDTLLNPRVIIEVLAPTTERWDREGKFTRYQQVGSLRQYILIRQDTVSVERFDRQADNSWLATGFADSDGLLTLDSVHASVAVQDIYTRVFEVNLPD